MRLLLCGLGDLSGNFPQEGLEFTIYSPYIHSMFTWRREQLKVSLINERRSRRKSSAVEFWDQGYADSCSLYYHAVELCFSNTIRLFGEISQRERSRARQQADMKKSIGSCLIRMQGFQISAC
jgi:hypothetical protein